MTKKSPRRFALQAADEYRELFVNRWRYVLACSLLAAVILFAVDRYL